MAIRASQHPYFEIVMGMPGLSPRLPSGRLLAYTNDSRGAAPGLEIENAARLAVRTGRVEAVARVIDELEQERAAIECRLAVAEPISVDLEALRRRIDAYARNLGQPSGRPRRRAGPCSRLFSATAVWPPTWTRIEASG
jgi:hypothetical protein